MGATQSSGTENIYKEYIKQNGVTKLPPDERGPDFIAISAWSRPKKKRGRKKKQKST